MSLIFDKFCFGLAAIAIVFAAALSASAATFSEHRATIDEAREFVGAMLIELAEAEAGIADFDHGPEDTAELRRLLPAAMKVETAQGMLDVSNDWLHKRLKDFDEATDLQEQALILTEIEERLTAISWSIGELEQAAERQRTKDEEKQKLAEILAREEYQKPAEQKESLLEQWLIRIGEWLSSLFPSRGPSGGFQGMGAVASVLQIVLVIGVIALVAFGVYKLAPLLFPGLRRKKKDKREDRVVLGEVIAADQSAETLFDEAEQFARSGDLRGAIRKGYIALLCELSDRKVVGLARHKTNRDYLKDVRKNRELHSNMNSLTNTFERHWYGTESGDESSWSEFRKGYLEALRQT